jgi:gamma-glutamyl-gamma-aminobutyrate hydrolase PuuD
MEGGRLVQHLDSLIHLGAHPVLDLGSNTDYIVVGNHHQACVLNTDTCYSLATGPEGVTEAFTTFYTEAILGVQFHPEWDAASEEYFRLLFNKHIRDFL